MYMYTVSSKEVSPNEKCNAGGQPEINMPA